MLKCFNMHSKQERGFCHTCLRRSPKPRPALYEINKINKINMSNCQRKLALECLAVCDPAQKVEATLALDTQGFIDTRAIYEPQDPIPGRPDKPELVDPKKVGTRSVHTPEGIITLLHAIAHIEFNAINLALDAAWRYPGMPEKFYREWINVAREEATHFNLLCERLRELGAEYGDLPAHNGLWEMAEKTQDDLMARLALVPRTLEARGLDVTPPLRDKFLCVNDQKSADILSILLRDEVGHVRVGNDWYLYFCNKIDKGPIEAYADLLTEYGIAKPRGPFNEEARLKAGFTAQEIAWLKSLQ